MRLLVCALLLSACDLAAPARSHAPADSAAGEVEFKLVGPNDAALVVPVSINGREPVDFVLDTGATLTCVDVSLARVLGLRAESPMGGIGIGAMTVGRIETVHIDTLRVGSAVAHDVIACRLDLEPLRNAFGAQGLLGLNFLKSFDVALDFERRVLRLTQTE